MLLLQFFSIALAQFSNELFFSKQKVQISERLLVHIRLEFLIDVSILQMLWHMCANKKYNCLQFAQQLIAYGLLSKTDESILA